MTFGNAAEFILALFVLRTGNTAVVKATIAGAIIGNSLLGLGASILVGSWGRARQTLHCAPHCTPPLVIGDNKEYFKTLGEQIKTKQSISQSSAQGDKQE